MWLQTMQLVHRLVCPPPHPLFAREKTRDQHARRKHNVKSDVRVYIDGSGVFPICKTVFYMCLRVLAHVGDKRRPKCRDRLLCGEVPAVDPNIIVALEAVDASARKHARKAGHTHPIAISSAKTADGKRNGCVRH